MKIKTYLAKDETEASKIKRRVTGIRDFCVFISPEKIDLFQKLEADYLSDKISQFEYYTSMASNDCILSEDGEHYVQIQLIDWHDRLVADKSLFPESPGLRDAMLQIIENQLNGIKA